MAKQNYPSKKALSDFNPAAITSVQTTANEAIQRDPNGYSVMDVANRLGKGWNGRIEFREVPNDELLPRRFVSAEIELVDCKTRNFKQFQKEWANIISVCSAVKNDGSVGGDGLELNTMPAKGIMFHKQMDLLRESFKVIKARADNSCGLHVHVDCRDLNGRQLFKLANIWACVEEEMIRLIKPSRQTNTFCRPFTAPQRTAWLEKKYNLESSIQDNTRRIQNNFGGNRYQALNFCALAAHNTVEFRLHHGTANAEVIRNWAILCSEIVDYATKCTMRQSRQATLSVIAKSKKLKVFLEKKAKSVTTNTATAEDDVFGF